MPQSKCSTSPSGDELQRAVPKRGAPYIVEKPTNLGTFRTCVHVC
jgi:hypothetical protein